MAIQYYMRGYNTTAPGTVGYVDWVVNDQPDVTKAFLPAPYLASNVINVVVNRAVTSKVGNFLNPSADGYVPNYTNPADKFFLHLNSYDWLNPQAPHLTTALPPPNQPIGIAVVRGTANGTTLNPYSSLYWDESKGQWTFAQINPDGSEGATQSLAMGPLNVDGYLGVQHHLTDPEATTGLIRIPNNQSIRSRDFANTTDIVLLFADGYNDVVLGSSAQNVVIGGTTANTALTPAPNTTSVAGNIQVLGNTTVNNIIFPIPDNHANIFQASNIGIGVTGFPLTISAQAALGILGIGGNLVLTSGHGTIVDGYVNVQGSSVNLIADGYVVAAAEQNKFAFLQGRRRNVTQIFDGYATDGDGYSLGGTSYYNVQLTDDYIAVTGLNMPLFIIMPTSPVLGDVYEFKDAVGLASTFNITFFGNGKNIDGSPTFVMSIPYQKIALTYNGLGWGV